MNILIIGLGSIAQKHITALRNIDKDNQIYALRSSTQSRPFENIIDIYDINRLENMNFDFAVISNPTAKHKETIEFLSHQNLPLFIEKPLHYSLDIEELVKEVTDKNIITYVACNLRFLDSLRYIKERLDHKDKRINEVNVYCGSYLPSWREGDYRKQYSAIPELGGGVHIDLIHELDYIYWFWGVPSAKMGYMKNSSSLEIPAIDYANYCFDYNSFCVNVVLNYYRKDCKRTLEIVFEDETWFLDLAKNQITSANDIIFSSSMTILDTYQQQMEYFISLLDKKKESFNTINDSFNTLKMALS